MRSILKAFISGSILAILVMYWHDIINFFEVSNSFQDSSDLLVRLGGTFGYVVIILFTYILQKHQFKTVCKIDKNKYFTMEALFAFITIAFILYALMEFNFTIALINLMFYLMVVSLFDMYNDKIINSIKIKKSHRKSII